MKSDNLIRLPRNPSGTQWPTCFRCWQPVELYSIVDEGDNHQTIQAGCSHKQSRVEYDTKRITMRRRWSHNKKANELAKVVFFTPSSHTPEHNDPGA